jgi:beta-galactosidase
MGTLTYDDTNFYMNGEKYTILSGAIHYFRVVPEYWSDRLLKLKACGFNTVETYTCWNLHEPREGDFNFSGILDIGRFIDTAAELGLNVILRPGPYICSEWDLGGLPPWLLKYPNIHLRCYDEIYLSKVKRYFKALFEHIFPRLSINGGNVIMLQIENEYGSYGNDKRYLQCIADMYKELGADCIQFTSDGHAYFMLKGGTLDGYLATVNFGDSPEDCFDRLKEYRPNQPLMCCEFWCGWFDHWYESSNPRDHKHIANLLDRILSYPASVNLYMFHGGTNFGFLNGANYKTMYQPDITSYDYDAPLSEAGDMTEKYYAIKEVIEKHFGKVPEMNVSNSIKKSYGNVELTKTAPLFDNLNNLSEVMHSSYPMTMEELDQNYGFVLYESVIQGPMERLKLEIDNVHDRALVYLNRTLAGVIERDRRYDEIFIGLGYGEELKVSILVENMGRINYGPLLFDRKGITGGVRIGQQYHYGWDMYKLSLDNIDKVEYRSFDKGVFPVFLKGSLYIEEEPADTFLYLDGFTKGVAFINGFNLGRYWNVGPQRSLYVPAPILKQGDNEIVIFELEGYISPEVSFKDKR